MPQPRSLHRPKQADFRELIHLLNQRYHQQWERAELLQVELARMRRWSLWPLIEFLRPIKRWFRPPAIDPGSEALVPFFQTFTESPAPSQGRVSIIIPFRDRLELLRNCLRSLRQSTYRRLEIILVDNGSSDPRVQHYLLRLSGRRHLHVVDCPGPFNYSRLCNHGARRAGGDYLLFLNNDIEVITPDWLERLLLLEQRPEIGAVGATLLYPNRTLQHTGIFPHPDGRWVHIYRGRPEDFAGDYGELRHIRSVPAVSAACLLLRRQQFIDLGGFDENLAVEFGDLDLCARLRRLGLLVVVTPHARLLHFESLSRGYALDGPRPSVTVITGKASGRRCATA